ncbi:hypothetical protein J4426_00110 [Candidatus Woesearchaeota archaeon]|nr:hypothetical protein [Candidatus Woesearchaeota archaeon]
MASSLQNALQFFKELGLFDVVLPFILVFALVYAVLEKTMILGKEKYGEMEVPNKNLNAAISFVVAMLVIASSQIVGVINEALPNLVLLMVVSLMFLLLIGVFVGTGEFNFAKKHKGANIAIMIAMFIGVVLVFLAAIRDSSGRTWLDYAWTFMIEQWSGTIFSSLLIFIVIILAIIYVTGSPKPHTEKGGDQE